MGCVDGEIIPMDGS